MFVLMAFGTQLFEWQIMSSMVNFQAKVECDQLLVERFAYQELERKIEKRSTVLAIGCMLAILIAAIFSI